LPAFWVGLLYDQSALDTAWDLVKDWTAEERQKLREDVPRKGLQTQFRGQSLRHLAVAVLAIAREGLNARSKMNAHGENETVFLQELDDFVRTGQSNADRLIEKYQGEWGGDILKAYEDCRY